MAKTLRSQNKCNDCRYTWYPRGKNLSRVCPNCGSENVAIVVNWTPLIAVAAIGLYVAFGGKPSNGPVTGDTSATPAESISPETAGQAAAPVDQVTTSPPPRTAEKEEFIEPARPAQLVEQAALPRPAPSPAPMLSQESASSAASATAAPSPLAKVDEYERLYTDEEISALEEQKQYRGDDPIVRSRLGIPSRETHKLIR